MCTGKTKFFVLNTYIIGQCNFDSFPDAFKGMGGIPPARKNHILIYYFRLDKRDRIIFIKKYLLWIGLQMVKFLHDIWKHAILLVLYEI